ncbi:MAG: hypothetical protein ACTSWE_06100 [Promethearchaeota archaeon]
MGKARIIILGWHFRNNITFNDNNNSYTWSSKNEREITGENYHIKYIIGRFQKNPICFEKSNHQYHLYLFAHPKGKIDNAFNTINGEIEKIINDNKENEILIYLHDKPWNPEEHFIKYQKPNKKNAVVHIQTGGSNPIYGNQGILNASKNTFTKPNITELPWDDFWDKLYINSEEKKNKLTQIWLPLAIDIQGLNEVREDNKRQKYFIDIKEYYKKNKIDQSEVEQISEIFKNNKIKKQIEKCKTEFDSILTDIESNKEVKGFYKSLHIRNKKPFPTLLQELIEIMDQQIKKD